MANSNPKTYYAQASDHRMKLPITLQRDLGMVAGEVLEFTVQNKKIIDSRVLRGRALEQHNKQIQRERDEKNATKQRAPKAVKTETKKTTTPAATKTPATKPSVPALPPKANAKTTTPSAPAKGVAPKDKVAVGKNKTKVDDFFGEDLTASSKGTKKANTPTPKSPAKGSVKDTKQVPKSVASATKTVTPALPPKSPAKGKPAMPDLSALNTAKNGKSAKGTVPAQPAQKKGNKTKVLYEVPAKKK